jgi:hypothetical protein
MIGDNANAPRDCLRQTAASTNLAKPASTSQHGAQTISGLGRLVPKKQRATAFAVARCV